MIRAVVDSSVLVSAFIGRSDAAPAQILRAWRERRISLIVSPQLVAELADVLSRPKFVRWSSGGRGEAYVAAIHARGEIFADPEPRESLLRDPDDDFLVALARHTAADVLVSVDRDVLDADVPGLQVVDPRTLLALLDE